LQTGSIAEVLPTGRLFDGAAGETELVLLSPGVTPSTIITASDSSQRQLFTIFRLTTKSHRTGVTYVRLRQLFICKKI